MQITAYLFNPEVMARFNKPNTVRNTVMWNKPLRVYKGADNFIDIVVNDFDLQPTTVNLYTFNFRVRDREQNLLLDKDIAIKTGFTNRLALNILEADLADVNIGMYTWGISLTDENGLKRPLYLELNGNAEGSIQVARWFFGAV
jgi:hypothetical protein